MKITGLVVLAGAVALVAPAAVQAEGAIDIGGKIKVRAYSESPAEGDATQRLYLKDFELGVEAEIDEGISAGGTLKRDGDEGDIEVDDAFVTAALAGDASITAGLLYLPFGVFETNMISDPLTLDLGEKRDPAVVVELSSDALHGTVYGYQRDTGEDEGRDDRIGGYGASVGYAVESGRQRVLRDCGIHQRRLGTLGSAWFQRQRRWESRRCHGAGGACGSARGAHGRDATLSSHGRAGLFP